MDYKIRFSPIELLRPEGWSLMSARERGARPPRLRDGVKEPCDLPMSDAEPADIAELG